MCVIAETAKYIGVPLAYVTDQVILRFFFIQINLHILIEEQQFAIKLIVKGVS